MSDKRIYGDKITPIPNYDIMAMAHRAVAFDNTQQVLRKWLYHARRVEIHYVANESETERWTVFDMSIAHRGEFLHKAVTYSAALQWALGQPGNIEERKKAAIRAGLEQGMCVIVEQTNE